MILYLLLCAFIIWCVYLWETRLDIKHPETGDVYLRRFHIWRNMPRFLWVIPNPLPQKLFLHRIYTADPDRHMHNHPWTHGSGSIILWGGYIEQRADMIAPYHALWTQSHRRCDVMRLQAKDYHKITLVRPNTWTLFFAGRRDRERGFLVDGKHVDWRTYLNLPADTELGD